MRLKEHKEQLKIKKVILVLKWRLMRERQWGWLVWQIAIITLIFICVKKKVSLVERVLFVHKQRHEQHTLQWKFYLLYSALFKGLWLLNVLLFSMGKKGKLSIWWYISPLLWFRFICLLGCPSLFPLLFLAVITIKCHTLSSPVFPLLCVCASSNSAKINAQLSLHLQHHAQFSLCCSLAS